MRSESSQAWTRGGVVVKRRVVVDWGTACARMEQIGSTWTRGGLMLELCVGGARTSPELVTDCVRRFGQASVTRGLVCLNRRG